MIFNCPCDQWLSYKFCNLIFLSNTAQLTSGYVHHLERRF